MPIYEYACDACATEFEKLVRRSSEEIECPKCGSTSVTRQVSAFAFKSGGGRFVSSSAKASSCAGCSSTGGCSGCGH
jgi:putative FmdB family regulatory protein